ncbi:hypothetical protein [Nannocystis pusilla]|uniref:hypothetical protein n=1 Tax=Nannocystis pusilla TaxID=889268 RepID=UPI003B776917
MRDELEVTCRPYFKDRTRQHVDINFTHPLDPAQPVRRRIVAPVGMDAVAATEWGRAEAFKLYRELCRGPVKVDNVERKEEENPKKSNVSTVKTLADFWPDFLAGHVAELKRSSKLNYESAWALHIREVLGSVRLDEIDEKALSRLRKRMRQELNLSYSYTRQVCESVSVALRYAQSEGELPKGTTCPNSRGPSSASRRSRSTPARASSASSRSPRTRRNGPCTCCSQMARCGSASAPG